MHSLNILVAKDIKFALFFDVGKAGIDLPRSQAATFFLQSEHTHMMFIDDDMAWQPELIGRMIELDRDILGVPYRQKEHNHIYTMRTPGDLEKSADNDALINVHDIATGLLLIKKRVFEVLKDKADVVIDHQTKKEIYMFFRHCIVEDKIVQPDGGHSYMSEDLYFCRQAREAGFQIWSYVDAETAHIGTTSFRGNYVEVLESTTKGNFRDTLQKQKLRLSGAIDG